MDDRKCAWRNEIRLFVCTIVKYCGHAAFVHVTSPIACACEDLLSHIHTKDHVPCIMAHSLVYHVHKIGMNIHVPNIPNVSLNLQEIYPGSMQPFGARNEQAHCRIQGTRLCMILFWAFICISNMTWTCMKVHACKPTLLALVAWEKKYIWRYL